MRLFFVLLAAAPFLSEASSCTGRVCNVLDFGATGDGKTVDTAAIRRAADAVAALGGGTLRFPSQCDNNNYGKGCTFLTSAFNLTSNMVLLVEEGATVLGNSDDRHDPWPSVVARTVWPQFGHGSDCTPGSKECRLMHQAFIFGWHVRNVSIEGAGTVDAQGSPFWTCADDLSKFPCNGVGRPHLLMISDGIDVNMKDITVKNSPDWTLHFSSVENLHVHNVRVVNPEKTPNTDGIDLDCVQNAIVENSYFDVGDDAVCVKSGIDYFGRTYGRPSKNIIFRNLDIGSGHGITIGSEMSGGVYNITFQNISLEGTRCGPRIKSQRGRGGIIDGITYRNITMSNMGSMFCVTLNYHDGIPRTNASATPALRNVLFEDIVIKDGISGGQFDGLDESPIHGIVLKNVVFQKPHGVTFGKCDNVVNALCEGTTNVCPPCFTAQGPDFEVSRLQEPHLHLRGNTVQITKET